MCVSTTEPGQNATKIVYNGFDSCLKSSALFLSTEVRMGLTYSSIALQCRVLQTAARNATNARKAYETALRFMPKFPESTTSLEPQLGELRSNLAKLGECFSEVPDKAIFRRRSLLHRAASYQENRTSWKRQELWRELYEAASREPNRGLRLRRIMEAQNAMLEHALFLEASHGSDEECRELEQAADTLRLMKIACQMN
jgi:hypothetical protein